MVEAEAPAAQKNPPTDLSGKVPYSTCITYNMTCHCQDTPLQPLDLEEKFEALGDGATATCPT